MKTTLILLVSILVLYITYRTYRSAKLSQGLDQQIANGAIILDVRTIDEYAAEHIKGSINMPLGQIRERYYELDPDQTYITTCSHGLRSVKSEKILKDRGFKNVYNGGACNELEKIINEQKKEPMIFIFKTDVSDDIAIKVLQPILDKYLPNTIWNFDLEDCDKILRIESYIEIASTTIKILKNMGYFCEELPD